MGLDQYAYIGRKGQREEFYEEAVYDQDRGEYVNPRITKPEEIMYWRKHPNLQGWMEHLWERKLKASEHPVPASDGWGSSFNGVELELTWDDLDLLEDAVNNKELPSTSGFFFGDDSDEHYKEQDLQFIGRARIAITNGLQVFYNSSW
jgi:hypothetical protein